MRLLQRLPAGDFQLVSFSDEDLPPYAILSHTWSAGQEVTYDELVAGTGRDKTGYAKIQFCGRRATADNLQYFWVDTCCINKSTSDELSTAINSMFRWYQRASKCYVYLSDVLVPDEITDAEAFRIGWQQAFRRSRWFTRGWTLQELLAPPSIEFFSKQGKRLGCRVSLEQEIHNITKIPIGALRGQSLSEFSFEERMSWTARRTTTLKEDKVYCLMGIFGVFLPLIYGEGDENATLRLKDEVQRWQQRTINTNAGSNVALRTPRQQTPAQDTMQYEAFLRSLSYPEMEYRFHNVDDVQDDTCRWLLNHRHYQEWYSGHGSSSLLIIRGKPGSGKSTALKRACTLARETTPANEAVIAFFFNSRGVSLESKLEGFFRSTLHQLLRSQNPTSNDAFDEWKRRDSSIRSGWAWTVRELQGIFERCVDRSTVKITMFVDALDECESPSAARNLMDLLTNIGSRHYSCQAKLKVCVSSRHYPIVGVAEPLQITVEDSNQGDITKYITISLRRLKIDIGNDLSEEITSRSRGMFLWAFLVLERIREAFEDGEPRRELRAIIHRTPLRLEEVFRELINDIPIAERERSSLVLSWMLFSKRPLSLSELNHALAFRNEYRTYSAYEKSDDFVLLEQMKRLLAKYTRGLVETVEIQDGISLDSGRIPTFRVQFIHESVREYMHSHPDIVTSSLNVQWSKPGFVDDILARSCFNYIKAVCVESGIANDIAGQLEARRFTPGRLCFDLMKDRPFLEYAIQFGFAHAKAADLSGVPPSYLFQSTSDGATGSASWWISFTSIFRLYWKRGYHDKLDGPGIKHWSESTTTPLAFACVHQVGSWVNHILEGNQPKLDTADLSKALCVTAAFGSGESVIPLVRAGADINYDEPMNGSPLYTSLVHGREDIVALLLGHEAAVPMGARKHSPLVAAVLHRSIDIVHLLLAGGAGVAELEPQEMSSWDDTWFSGMHALKASIQRNIEILEALLPCAEHQEVPVECYKAAYLEAVAAGKSQHATGLESVITRLFPGHTTILVFIKTLTGKTVGLNVWADTQIFTLKKVLRRREGPPPDELMFSFGWRILRDHQTLRDYDIQRESTIDVLLRARWRGVSGG